MRNIEVDESTCRRNLKISTALATALVPVLGYDRMCQLVKQSLLQELSLRALLLREAELTPEFIEDALDSTAMTRPPRAPSVPLRSRRSLVTRTGKHRNLEQVTICF